MSGFFVLSHEELQSTLEKVLKKFHASRMGPDVIKVKELMNLPEAADYCRMPEITFRCYLNKREVLGSKIGRSWRFYKADLDQFIIKNQKSTIDDIEREIDDLLSK